MPCPFYSKTDNECSLLPVAPVDDEDESEEEQTEPVDRALCLGDQGAYRNCPVFQRRTLEQTKAF